MEIFKKIIFWAVVVWAIASTAFAVVMLIRGEVKIVKNQYITTNSKSESFANSGSVAIGYIGEIRGKWSVNIRAVESDKLDAFLNSLAPAQFTFAKVVKNSEFQFLVIYPDFLEQTDHKVGDNKTSYEEKLNVR